MKEKRTALSTGTLMAKLFEAARGRIDDAFLKEWEKRLKLASPDDLFRQKLWRACDSHLLVPPGGLAAVKRKNLSEEKTYLNAVQTHLSGLLNLLPHESFREHAQASLIRIAVIGSAPAAEQSLRASKLFELRATLEDLLSKMAARATELNNMRIPANEKLGAVRILVSQLAGIFWESTGEDPRNHIRGNNANDKYSGLFFDFADAILKRLGSKQSPGQRGKMINQQLLTFSTSKK